MARRIDEGRHYFLSRPGRLLVGTIKDLLEGDEQLFRGLAVDDACYWTASFLVVCPSFGRAGFEAPGLVAGAGASLSGAPTRRLDLALSDDEPSLLGALIEAVHAEEGRRVVVVADE